MMASLTSEQLKEAALKGDVEFLRRCVACNQPTQYYMAFFPQINNDDHYNGNIFHIAACAEREEFIREAIGMLPVEATQQLLVQPLPQSNENPLHVAVYVGNIGIVKMFVNVFSSVPSHQSHSQPPWLLKDSGGNTPCHVALTTNHNECALEIFKTDKEFLGNIFFDGVGNIFHFAALENREDFVREAIKMLPVEHTQPLLCKAAIYGGNPLHIAASTGNAEIVKIFLDVYKLQFPPDLPQRPWLLVDSMGDNPCFVAVYNNHEDCALEILKMDKERLCNKLSHRHSHLLYEAIIEKCTKLAREILASHSIGCNGNGGFTAFHAMFHLEYSDDAKAIFQLLLEREPKIIDQRNEIGNTAFHEWAAVGKVWPFKSLLERNNIIQDVRKVFVDLIALKNRYGRNPLHALAQFAPNEEASIELSKLLVDTYKREASSISGDDLPWLVQDKDGHTALSLAIGRKFQKLATYVLSVDENTITKSHQNVLFLAIEKGCHEVAEKIMEIIENKQWTQLLTNQQQKNALHLAPLCTRDFCVRLLKRHPDLFEGVMKGGVTILHSWIKNCETWLFEFILKSEWRVPLINLIDATDHNDGNNPLNTAATTNHEAMTQAVTLLVEAYKQSKPNWKLLPIGALPWFRKNKKGWGPLQSAIQSNSETLALYILSLYEPYQINELLDFYKPEHSTLFLAIRSNCTEVAKEILARLDKKSWTKYLEFSDGQNILHGAPYLKDKEFGTWLVGEALEFIAKENNRKETPLDVASSIGASWFIEAALRKDPSVLEKVPLAWVKACDNGHISAIRAFVKHNPGKFRDQCIKLKDSPLHHIQLPSLTECEEFFEIPRMKDLINLQNSDGETPLHIALRNEDISLAEILLSMNVKYDIKNKENKTTAIDMLEHVCREKEEWEAMCYRNGLDPYVKTSYFERKTNLLEVRNSLFVVAALLATITFTAGFTLPGGLNQESGEALLTKKPGFLAFLVFDTLAMCSSMLVLICLVWSMVSGSEKALVLIDRSMMILMVAFYCTLLAFMTAVYIVTSPNVLWAAIVVIVICSLIGISANRGLLYKILLVSSTKQKNDQKDRLKQV